MVVSGSPSAGETVVLGVDNPLGSQGVGALPFLALSLAPDPGFPCGTPIPGWGMAAPGTAAGELLLGLPLAPELLFTAPVWAGPGQPSPVALPIPDGPAVFGLRLYAQGLLVEPLAPTFALTEALELRIGP